MGLINSVSRFILQNPALHRAINIALLCVMFWLSSRFFIPFSNEPLGFYQVIAGGLTLGYVTTSFAGVSGTESHRTALTAVFSSLLAILSLIDICFR